MTLPTPPHVPDPSSGVHPARLDANWRAITIELDAPRPCRAERALRAIGIPSRITRLVLATPSLRRAWYMALAGAIVVGLISTDTTAPRQSLLPLLIIAPLVPVLGVSMAYGPASDPAHEVQLATPMRGLRLLAIRSAVVLVVSAVTITSMALLNGVARPFAAAWLLPALAVTSVSILLMTWLAPRRATTAAAIAWVTCVLVSQVATDPLAAFSWAGQLVAAIVTIGAIAGVIGRRQSFDHWMSPA